MNIFFPPCLFLNCMASMATRLQTCKYYPSVNSCVSVHRDDSFGLPSQNSLFYSLSLKLLLWRKSCCKNKRSKVLIVTLLNMASPIRGCNKNFVLAKEHKQTNLKCPNINKFIIFINLLSCTTYQKKCKVDKTKEKECYGPKCISIFLPLPFHILAYNNQCQ
jgi:hypothetical protein